MDKVQPNDAGCWIWQGYVRPNGYGYFRTPDDTFAHRISWRLHRGEIPAGLELDHLCRVKSCVNPEHLEAVPREINQRRAQEQRRGCPERHPDLPPRWGIRTRGERYCKECSRFRKRKSEDRRHELLTHQARIETLPQ